MTRNTFIIIGLSILLVVLVVVGFIMNSNNKFDQKLEPVITKISGITRYTESSKILKIDQYYNEQEDMHYYDIEFEYEYYPIDSDVLTYKKKEAVIIIDHDIRGSNGDFYFKPELELDKNKAVLDDYNETIEKYDSIASYSGSELDKIVDIVLKGSGLN